MIRHHHVHDVLRAPLRHVAGDAVFVCAMRFLVARQTCRAVLLAREAAMRVVARETGQLARALAKAAALFEPIRMMIDLESVFLSDIDRRRVMREQLSGTK